MRQLLVPLIVVFLLFGLLAESAAGAAPEQKIVRNGATFAPGESGTLIVTCPLGYKAVAAAIVQREAGILVFYGFEDTTENGLSRWVFRLMNFGSEGAFVRGEVRCVKVFEPPGFGDPYEVDLTARETLDPGEFARLVAICPRGDAPLGWGWRESAPGGSFNDPPRLGAANRLFEVQPSGRRYIFGVEGAGVFPSEVQFQAICIDRHLENRRFEVDFQVTPRLFFFSVGANDSKIRNLRCERGAVPGAPGWSLPDRQAFFPGIFDIRVGENEVGFANQTDTARRVEANQPCLGQEVRRR